MFNFKSCFEENKLALKMTQQDLKIVKTISNNYIMNVDYVTSKSPTIKFKNMLLRDALNGHTTNRIIAHKIHERIVPRHRSRLRKQESL